MKNATIFILFELALLLSACAATPKQFHQLSIANPTLPTTSTTSVPSLAPKIVDCGALAQDVTVWTSVASGLGALAGAGGLSTIPIQGQEGRAIIGISSLVIGAAAAVAGQIGRGYAQEFANDRCVSF